jgi:chromosome segregation ATPase
MSNHNDCATHSHLMKTIDSMWSLRRRINELEQENDRLKNTIEMILENISRIEHEMSRGRD